MQDPLLDVLEKHKTLRKGKKISALSVLLVVSQVLSWVDIELIYFVISVYLDIDC